MYFWLFNILAALFLSIICSGIIIPQILLISFRKRLFDVPDKRKIHQGVVPRLGGIAFMPVIFFTMALLMGVDILIMDPVLSEAVDSQSRPIAFGLCAMLMLFVVGMADDLIGVRYRAKFVTQIMCAVLIIAGGLWVSDFHGLLGIGTVSRWVGYPLAILLTVGIINAINLIDGIDGLASGLSSIACTFYGVVFFMAGEYFYATFAFASLGVLVPFFYYNVFGDARKQKKIFMGDTGSLTIGIILVMLSIRILQFDDGPGYLGGANLAVIAYSPLLVPCFDVIRVYFHRIKRGHNPFLPDRNHIHHLFLALGLSQRRALTTIVAISLGMTLVNVAMSVWINVNLVLLIDAIVWILGVRALHKAIKRRGITADDNPDMAETLAPSATDHAAQASKPAAAAAPVLD